MSNFADIHALFSSDPELMFLPRTASVRNTCHRQHRELMCCAHNFQSLRWHRFDNTSQTWTEVELSSHVYHRPEGDPRKLVLERPDFSDAGWYRCVAANDLGQEIVHNISLRVHGTARIQGTHCSDDIMSSMASQITSV